ncbi:MAG: serine hydrolase domain-containing protein [Xanthomonadales bacterium]|nr:serine hydrolase domain-containing protein [Xanthomonadales bacterium]
MPRAPISPIFLASIIFLFWSIDCLAADDNLEDAFKRIAAEEGLTGIVWALVHENGDITSGSAGVSDNRTGVGFAPDTRFHVGSLTKTVLATGLLRLATEGRIDLDAPALQYLTDLFPDDPPAGFADVTVRHLLDHTGGLNDAHMWQMFSERADQDAPLVAAFPDAASQLRVRSPPGSRFSYSNMGYTLLGMIIESIAGERYESYLDEQLLAPLGMHDSTFTFTTQEGEHADPMLAWGHVDDGSRYAASPMFLRPAGQFTSTAADLARFAQFLLGDGAIEGRRLVDESLMRSRGTPVGTGAAEAGLVAGYALGLARRDRHGVVGYCHGGNIVGFVAMLCIFPGERKAFAYSVNTDSETANYGRLDRLLVEALEIADAPTPRTVAPSPDIADWHGRYVLSPNRFQMFDYLDTVFGAMKISADGDSVVLASMQQDARLLQPVGDYLYSANDRATTSHAFFTGDNGEYLISDGFLTYEKIPAANLVAHWTSVLLGLAGLTWVLIAGTVSLVRHRSQMFRRAEAPAYFASVLLFVPLPFFLSQSFMALGDFTPASFLLALVTFLLPIGMLTTVLLASKTWKTSRIDLLNATAAASVLQWCIVLAAAGMLPFRLWA